MNKKLSSWLQTLFFLGLAIFLVWWSIGKISAAEWQQMKAALLRTNYWLLLPVAIALLLSHYSRAMRWKILMEPLGYRPGNMNTYLAVLIGYFANLMVPRLGEVLKCTLLARYEKVPADKLIGTIVAERAFDLICLMLVFAITIFSQIDIIGTFTVGLLKSMVSGNGRGPNYGRLALLLGGLLLLLLGAVLLLRKFAQYPAILKIKKIVRGIWEGLTSVRYVKKKGWFFFHSAAIWFLYLASIRLGFYAMSDTQSFGWLPSFSVLSLGSVGMIVTQGGIGAYPILVQETLALYGLDANVGRAFGWLLWLAQSLLIVVAGGLAFLLLPIVNRKKPAAEESV
ncbi:MAG: lysylphosphatidylglycerol synthase transmembrane domain-containing protein [Flavihumibacter sp.]